MAELLVNRRITNDHGDIIQVRIWRVPKSDDFPEGVKYSMVYIRVKGEKYERVLGYDNERGKGHHKHFFGEELPIKYTGIDKLVEMFFEDVRRVEVMLYGEVEKSKD
ncbi:toxin-antitoxin system TumE family protein [Archaeoglobus sp.]